MCDPATQQMDLDEPEDRRSELEEVRRGNLFDEVRTPHRTQHAARRTSLVRYSAPRTPVAVHGCALRRVVFFV